MRRVWMRIETEMAQYSGPGAEMKACLLSRRPVVEGEGLGPERKPEPSYLVV